MAPFSEIVKKAWDTVFHDTKSFWVAFLLMGCLGFIFNIAISIIELQNEVIKAFVLQYMEPLLGNVPLMILIALGVICLGIIVLALSLYASFLAHKIITQNAQNKHTTFMHTVADSKDFGAYIGTGILQFLIGVCIGLGFMFIFFIGALLYNILAGFINGGMIFDITAVVVLIIFAIIFISIIVYVSTVLVFTYAAFFVDHIRYMAALKKSFMLVKGRWWKTFGYMFIFSICVMIVSMLINALPSIGIFFSGSTIGTWINMLGILIQTVSQTIISMIGFAFILALYGEYKKHLVIRTDAQ